MGRRARRELQRQERREDEADRAGSAVPSARTAVYDGVGLTLRAVRERRGQSLTDIARVLRIRAEFLDALERGRFDVLPGRIYAAGFLRSYALHLGLDPDAVVEAFKQELAHVPEAERLSFPTPAPEQRLPPGWLIVGAVIAALAVYGSWHYLRGEGETVVERVAPVPEHLAREVPPPEAKPVAPAEMPPRRGTGEVVAAPVPVVSTAVPAVPAAAPAAEPVQAPPPAPALAPPAVMAAAPPPLAAVPAPRAPALPAAVPPPTSPPVPAGETSGYVPVTYGAANADVRIVLRARSDSWVQVQGPNNELLLTRILKPGDSYRVPNRPDLALNTGNAGGIEILVDGQPVPALGPIGLVQRNIRLDPEALREGRAVRR